MVVKLFASHHIAMQWSKSHSSNSIWCPTCHMGRGCCKPYWIKSYQMKSILKSVNLWPY